MSRIRFQKRQKEMKRQQKQQLKAEKRALRKLTKNAPPDSQDVSQGELQPSDEGLLDDVNSDELSGTSQV